MNMKVPDAKLDYMPFEGGIDTETPAQEMPPGRLRDSFNFECNVTGKGYREIEGYERFDGRTFSDALSPAAAVYKSIPITHIGTMVLGDAVTQLVSGATGTFLGYEPSGATTRANITKITGTFDATHDLQVAAVSKATASGSPTTSYYSGTNPYWHAYLCWKASGYYRAAIGAVPGQGSIEGVFILNDVAYAIRTFTGGAESRLYQAVGGGWTQKQLGFSLPFTSGGTVVSAVGNTITGAISGATAVLTRVMLESGSFAGGDAAGKFIFLTKTGNFQAETLNIGASIDVATIAGNATAQTITPGCEWRFTQDSVAGAALHAYGYDISGGSQMFDFDGSVFSYITTPLASDRPAAAIVHKNRLFVSYAQQMMYSGLGTAYAFTVALGGAEVIVDGSTITQFGQEMGAEVGGASLVVYTEKSIKILYGSSASDFNLVPFKRNVGAVPGTLMQMGLTVFLDFEGIATLKTTADYGNFQHDSLSRNIQRLIAPFIKSTVAGARVHASLSHSKNQYRLFFYDSSNVSYPTWGLYVTMLDGKVAGIMRVGFPERMTCVGYCQYTSSYSAGEMTLFGATDGYVYQLDKGTLFDAAARVANFLTHAYAGKSLGWIKKYIDMTLQGEGSGYNQFTVSAYYENSEDGGALATSQTNENERTGSYPASSPGQSFYWDYTDNSTGTRKPAPATVKLGNESENIQIGVNSSVVLNKPLLLTGALIRLILRRQKRW